MKRDNFENYQLVDGNYPYIYQIEATEKCNLNCPACINSMVKNKKHIDIELIDKIIKKGWLINTPYTELQMSGEPTLHPQIDSIVDKLRSHGVWVGMSTNLKKYSVKHKLLFNRLDAITISADSFVPEIYEKSRYPNKWITFENNLKVFLNFISSNVLVYIQLLKTSYTDQHYIESVERAKEFLKVHGKPNIFVRHVEDCFADAISGGKTDNNDMCINPHTSVSIKADGTVVPCCYDFLKKVPLGNIHDEDLLDIWQGKKYEDLRNSFGSKKTRFELCQHCPFKSPMKMMWIFVNDLIKFKKTLR